MKFQVQVHSQKETYRHFRHHLNHQIHLLVPLLLDYHLRRRLHMLLVFHLELLLLLFRFRLVQHRQHRQLRHRRRLVCHF